jgi:(p)ppGpp synthase/HD superfamily hydrolase
MVDTTPFKICIQRAETRQEWDAMQNDYINRSLEAYRRIEQLEIALKFLIRCEEVTEATAKASGEPYVNKGLDFARTLVAMEKKDE